MLPHVPEHDVVRAAQLLSLAVARAHVVHGRHRVLGLDRAGIALVGGEALHPWRGIQRRHDVREIRRCAARLGESLLERAAQRAHHHASLRVVVDAEDLRRALRVPEHLLVPSELARRQPFHEPLKEAAEGFETLHPSILSLVDQQRLDILVHFHIVGRSADEQVGSHADAARARLAVVEHGEHDDGDVVGLGILLQTVAYLVAVHPRKHDVEQDEVRMELLSQLHHHPAVSSLLDAIAPLHQHVHHHLPVRVVVVDDEHFLIHTPLLAFPIPSVSSGASC